MTPKPKNKREIRESPRTRGHKPGYRTIAIICEGSKTEKLYFSNYKERYANLHIDVPNADKYTDPVNLVRHAVDYAHKNRLDLSKDQDSVWCVCDVDQIGDAKLLEALALAKENDVQFVLSNPCFELWYLLHFKRSSRFLNNDELQKTLAKEIKGYAKNRDVFAELKGEEKLEQAIKNSQILNKFHQGLGRNLYTRASNPSTQVHELVQHIQQIKRDNGITT